MIEVESIRLCQISLFEVNSTNSTGIVGLSGESLTMANSGGLSKEQIWRLYLRYLI